MGFELTCDAWWNIYCQPGVFGGDRRELSVTRGVGCASGPKNVQKRAEKCAKNALSVGKMCLN